MVLSNSIDIVKYEKWLLKLYLRVEGMQIISINKLVTKNFIFNNKENFY